MDNPGKRVECFSLIDLIFDFFQMKKTKDLGGWAEAKLYNIYNNVLKQTNISSGS